ncbi:hypothetical protein NMG60_11002735 [Bertholletia excelsa]
METGKKKIEIKKITKESSRMVTFSKRRKGLFKKADDLHLATGVSVALIVFSPADRCYTHSSGELPVDAAVDRYLAASDDVPTGGFGAWLNAIDLEAAGAEDLQKLELLRERLMETRQKVVSQLDLEMAKSFLLD